MGGFVAYRGGVGHNFFLQSKHCSFQKGNVGSAGWHGDRAPQTGAAKGVPHGGMGRMTGRMRSVKFMRAALAAGS
jgi:hypothetical protein